MDNSLHQDVHNIPLATLPFDHNGHIRLDFDDDGDRYDVAAMQQQLRMIQEQRFVHQNAETNMAANLANVPCMSICIMIVGTRGDVQPFIGIAKRLQEDGHRVRLATHAVYREFVTSYDVEFYPLGGDPKELAAYMVKTGGHLIPLKLETIQKDVPRNMQMIDEILNSTWPAVSEADPDAGGKGIPGKPFQAQAIISNPVTYGHIHVAERLGVPLHIMFPQPWVPTVEFPHPLSNLPYKNKQKRRNYLSYKAVDLLMWQGTESIVNKFRKKVLGLRKIRKGDGGRDILLDLAIPHAFMWSPALVPKPADWGKIYDVVGTVTLKEAGSKYTPTPELEAFLGNDDGPIFVGFGSMVLKNPLATTKMIIDAAAQAKVRVLIQSSWSDMSGDIVVPDNIFFLGNCPHDWLMPRVSAVVHHGGAGTTAAGLLAGKPTFIVPFFGDQPFWGRAVVTAGVGVEPCPISELTVEKLRIAFEGLKSPELRARAMTLRDVMQKEDGVEEAVKSFYRHLPIHDMRCDLDCNRAATKWSQKDKMKLCNDCEFVVTMRPENSSNDIVDYHYVDYSARGPNSTLEGATAGIGVFFHELGGGWKDIIAKPVQGYKENGAKGAAIGLVKGVVSGVYVRPVQGAVLLADHVATGHYNEKRSPTERKKGSMLSENKQLFKVVGVNVAPEAHTAAMSPDEMIAVEKTSTEYQVAVHLSEEEKQNMANKFYNIANQHTGMSAGSERRVGISDAFIDQPMPIEPVHLILRNLTPTDTVHSRPLPKMKICMLATGSWEDAVGKYVAIGLRLAADGHRVRIATHIEYRERIIAAGLEFYPLRGCATTIDKFLSHLICQYEEDQRMRSNSIFSYAKSKLHLNHKKFSEIDDLKELVYSLWPACVDVDPLSIGTPFRADVIITDPFLVGITAVAERLGVPLHCISCVPLSRTKAFRHFMDPSFALQMPYVYETSNFASYNIISQIFWKGQRSLLNDFRSTLGLPEKSVDINLLAEWRIPHTYLWNEKLLPKPMDWGNEVTIAGCIESNEIYNPSLNDELTKMSIAIETFIATNLNRPMIYFGFAHDSWGAKHVDDLLLDIKQAATSINIAIIFQTYKDDHRPSLCVTDTVLEINRHFPVKRVLPYVTAAIHWGDLSITSACLAAGKPACVVPRNITEQLWGRVLELAGVGMHYTEMSAHSVDNLLVMFRALLSPELARNAQQLATTFPSNKEAIDNAVKAFYGNLPLDGMTCDLDPCRVARVYCPTYNLKLSYEAYLVVKQLVHNDSCGNMKYKPLSYSMHHAPRFSLRDLQSVHSTIPNKSTSPYSYNEVKSPNSKLGDATHAATTKLKNILEPQETMTINVIEAPAFWTDTSVPDPATKRINIMYEKLLKTRQ